MSIIFKLDELKSLINEYGNLPIKQVILLERKKRLLYATCQNKHIKA
ncbi:hypothetical protein [Clostridium perfringens]